MKNIKQIISIVLMGCALFAAPYSTIAESRIIYNPTNKHWYQRFDKSMGWYAAKDFCEKKGGYLVTITSQNENDFVWGKLASHSPNSGGTWIGATNDKQGVYKWITGEAWSFTNWASGEPNNFQIISNGGEHYASFFDPATNGQWVDISSYNQGVAHRDGYREISTICEWVGGNSSRF